jgi:hypothetical protein
MKNIIFLDIDGVLNCELHYKSKNFTDYKEAKRVLKKAVKSKEIERMEYYGSQLCPDRIKLLNELCKNTDSKIVVSSTWRSGKSVVELQEIFNHFGGTFAILDKTGYCECRNRGCEIHQWLQDNCMTHFGVNYYDFYRYAIIDDDSDMLLGQANHFFQTDTYAGLTHNICYKIERFFTHKTF